MADKLPPLPEGFTLDTGMETPPLPEGFTVDSPIETTQAPLTNASGQVPEITNPPGVLKQAYGFATEAGLLPDPQEAAMGLEVGAEALATGMSLPIAGAGASLIGATAGKGVDIIAQKLGIRPDVSMDDDLTDFATRLGLASLVPGFTALAIKTKPVVGNLLAKGANKALKNKYDIATHPGGIVSKFGVPTKSQEYKDYLELVEYEGTIGSNEVLSGGKNFNAMTGKFEGVIPGEPVTFQQIRKNVKNALYGNVEEGVRSIESQRDEILEATDKAFLTHNKLKLVAKQPSEMIPTVTGDLVDLMASDLVKNAEVLKKIPQMAGAGNDIIEQIENIKKAITSTPISERGPKFLSETVRGLSSFLVSLKAFDKAAMISKELNPSKLSGVKETINTVKQMIVPLKQARDNVLNRTAEMTGLDQVVFNSKIINTLDENYAALKRLDKQLTRRNTEIQIGLDPKREMTANMGGVIGGKTGVILNTLTEPVTDLGQSMGVITPGANKAIQGGEDALARAQESSQLRQRGSPYSMPIQEVPSVGAGVMTGGAVAGSIPKELGLFSQEAEASMLVAPKEALELNKEIEKNYNLLEASNKFGMDLSTFPSVEIDNGKVFVEDPNDQQDILGMYRDDPSVPMSHYYKQANKFNDKRTDNELLPIPKSKKSTSSMPSIRLKKGSSDSSGNYSY